LIEIGFRLLRLSDRQEDRIKDFEHIISDKLIQGEQVTALDLKLNKSIEDTENKLEGLTADVTASRRQLETEVKKLKEDLNTATEANTCQIEDIALKVSGLEGSYERLNAAVEKRESHVSLLQATCKRTAIDYARQKDEDAIENQRLTTLEEHSGYHAEQIELLEKNEEGLRVELKTQKTEGESLRQQIRELQTQVADHAKELQKCHIAKEQRKASEGTAQEVIDGPYNIAVRDT
jgi:chromosome segregation ATPase